MKSPIATQLNERDKKKGRKTETQQKVIFLKDERAVVNSFDKWEEYCLNNILFFKHYDQRTETILPLLTEFISKWFLGFFTCSYILSRQLIIRNGKDDMQPMNGTNVTLWKVENFRLDHARFPSLRSFDRDKFENGLELGLELEIRKRKIGL